MDLKLVCDKAEIEAQGDRTFLTLRGVNEDDLETALKDRPMSIERCKRLAELVRDMQTPEKSVQIAAVERRAFGWAYGDRYQQTDIRGQRAEDAEHGEEEPVDDLTLIETDASPGGEDECREEQS
jgi:hypothetical protein